MRLSTSPSLPLLLQSVHPASYEECPSALFNSDQLLSEFGEHGAMFTNHTVASKKERKKERQSEGGFVCGDTSSVCHQPMKTDLHPSTLPSNVHNTNPAEPDVVFS